MKQLFEGVKFGDREKALIMKHVDDYNVGIEYEMHYYNQYKLEELAREGFEFLVDRLREMDKEDVLDNIYSIAIDNSVELNFLSEGERSPLFVSMIRKVYEIDQRVKQNIPSDEEKDSEEATDDMFGGKDDPKLYVKLFNDSFTEDEFNQYVDFFGEASSNSIDDWDSLVQIIDVYYEGEFLNGDPRLAEVYGDYIKIISKIMTKSDNEKDILSMFDSMANVELTPPAAEESLSYTIQSLNSSNLPLDDYLTFRSEHYEVEIIEELVTDAATSDIADEAMGSSDEYGTPSEDDLRNAGVDVSQITDISTDHGDQAEIITDKLNVQEAFQNITQMFNFISDFGETSHIAGMHISISTNKYNLDDFNLMKFVALLDLDHVLELFPERTYVDDLESKIKDAIGETMADNIANNYNSNNGFLSVVELIKEAALDAKRDIEIEKYQSIKFGDYKFLDGRIELRFFGGEDYHQMEEEVKHHLLRALYILNFAYTDEYNKVYYKKLAKLVSAAVKDYYGVSLSDLVAIINRYNKMSDTPIDEMYERYTDIAGSLRLPDELQKFEKYMIKNFGSNWSRKLDFLRYMGK